MSNLRKDANHHMVVLARESRGLSQKELAAKLEVTQGRISKIEMGLLPVPDDLLEKLAYILDYPEHFFLQSGSILGVGITEVFHRKRQEVSKKMLARAYALMDLRLKELTKLLQATEISYFIPRHDPDEFEGRIEEIARLVREEWRVPRGPIQDLTQTLEDQGVFVVPIDFQTTKVDAISRWLPTLPPMFFVNKDIPKDRYRFSIAHELGHMVMHEIPNVDMEEQANRFAGEFLLPERDVRADLVDLNLAKLTVLKRYWKVSMSALLHRAETLGTITANRARYLWTQMGQAGYRTREPIELDVTGEEPCLLKEVIEVHQKELGYSIEDLATVLALNEDELRLLCLPEDQDRPPLRLVRP